MKKQGRLDLNKTEDAFTDDYEIRSPLPGASAITEPYIIYASTGERMEVTVRLLDDGGLM